MTFEELYNKIILSGEVILGLVDEYTLYCYYTGIDNLLPGRAYNAPYYRRDTYPSFSIFASKSNTFQYMWKDHATGEFGTIFSLIQKIENLKNIKEVFARIDEDFALGYSTTAPVKREKIVWYNTPQQNDIKIRVNSQPLTVKGKQFWDRFRIGQDLLDEYCVSQVEFFWLYDGQPAPNSAIDPTFSYRIGEYYQLYSPFVSKEYKFRNDLPEDYFFGYLQLPPTGDVLIIDKSSKDVIFCRRLGYWSVSGKSETTFIPDRKILELKERFKTIYLTLDNDKAGRQQTEKYMKLYPWLLPRFLEGAKDKTDLCLKLGFDESARIIRTTIQ